MKSAGIIAEYNPFHFGHAYQIQQLRILAKADVIVIAMSGNVVQRGEFAIFDKWKRAELAVRLGADLVVELPLLASLQSADYFAKYGVMALSDFAVDTFAFGTEEASTKQLLKYVEFFYEKEDQFNRLLRQELEEGSSYAVAADTANKTIFSNQGNKLNWSSPNHILAIQYLFANQKLAKPMTPIAIPRIKYNQSGHTLLSGSQVRKRWFEKQLTSDTIPELVYLALREGPTIQWCDYWELIKYQLTVQDSNRLANIFQMREGFENHLKKQLLLSKNYSDFLDRLTSKRWTKASVQRVLLAVLLQLEENNWLSYQEDFLNRPSYRLLGFNQKGKEYLNELKYNQTSKIITKLGREDLPAYYGNLQADKVFSLNPKQNIREQNYQTLLYRE